MRKEKLKMLQVWNSTHRQIKKQAAKAKMPMRQYIQRLADMDKGDKI